MLTFHHIEDIEVIFWTYIVIHVVYLTMFNMICFSNLHVFLICRLDYSGIAFLIVGSFIPYLYYGFYCMKTSRIVYMVTISTLGTLCIIISLWDKFSTPKFRPLRAGKYFLLYSITQKLHSFFPFLLQFA